MDGWMDLFYTYIIYVEFVFIIIISFVTIYFLFINLTKFS